ncbi:TetR family transcriptional regulator [Allosaccharopolyspora coralli]|uniref:TetR family transcriptional regulator n=1 Tax=Allosaccharopolyspora coralli TaxID=2665642 RepID=A0A5Q3QGH3_9PSEU|nr:TetR family transcriptional regulator [Allosaccharopolyspora coralli]
MRLVEREGSAAVSHRAVAKEAGVSAASIAYYFDSIDELLIASLFDSVDVLVEQIGEMKDRVDDSRRWPAEIAAMLASMIHDYRGNTLAEYELYLLAARRPALRPAARKWREVAAASVNDGRGADEGVLTAFFAAIDGLLLHGLIADEPPSAAELERPLRFLLQPLDYFGVDTVP